MTKPEIKGILFDFDGTLAKTMEDHYAAWKNTLLPLGIKLQPEEYFPFEGMTVHRIAQKVCEDYGLSFSLSTDLIKKKEEYYLRNNSFSFYPGVEEMIIFFKKEGFKLGIVTAGLLDRIKKTVSEDFLALFEVIITGDQTKEGKPSPEPYLKGLDRLGLGPEQCIVIENAPLGIKAAKAAGTYCIAIVSTVERQELMEADEIIDSFSNLLNSKVLTYLKQD